METVMNEEGKPIKTKAQQLEGIAFTLCKASTILLLTSPLQRFALPVVAGACAVFYLLAHINGQRASRCVLQKPLVIAAFWGMICALSLFRLLH